MNLYIQIIIILEEKTKNKKDCKKILILVKSKLKRLISN